MTLVAARKIVTQKMTDHCTLYSWRGLGSNEINFIVLMIFYKQYALNLFDV